MSSDPKVLLCLFEVGSGGSRRRWSWFQSADGGRRLLRLYGCVVKRCAEPVRLFPGSSSACEALRSVAVLDGVLSVPVLSFRVPLMGNTAEQLKPAHTLRRHVPFTAPVLIHGAAAVLRCTTENLRGNFSGFLLRT